MNLRSFAIGMRIDQWLADDHPELRALQVQGIEALQKENLRLLSQRAGRLAIPVPLLAPLAACALFADRLLGTSTHAIPYPTAGALDPGPSCWPSSTGCRPAPRTTASWSTPGPATSG